MVPGQPAGVAAVCHGPAYGEWQVKVYVPSLDVAEAVLARWRQEHPGQVVALLRGGERAEDEQRKAERMQRERAAREAAHFLALGDEARREGKHRDARYYRRCAAQFLDMAAAKTEQRQT